MRYNRSLTYMALEVFTSKSKARIETFMSHIKSLRNFARKCTENRPLCYGKRVTQAATNPYQYSDTNKRYYTYDYVLKTTFGGKALEIFLCNRD